MFDTQAAIVNGLLQVAFIDSRQRQCWSCYQQEVSSALSKLPAGQLKHQKCAWPSADPV